MKKRWTEPKMEEIPFDTSTLKNVETMSDAELKITLEKGGYKFSKKFQSKSDYVHRRIVDNDVLISVGENIANFNGYIELNDSATFIWKQILSPIAFEQLVQHFAEEFHLSEAEAELDVSEFLQELVLNEMITLL